MNKTFDPAVLNQVYGSENFYRHGIVRNVIFTDGAKYVADSAGAGTKPTLQERKRTMPEMTYVDSSNIEAIGYDEGTQELHVQLLSGDYYVYHDVPRRASNALMSSMSKGSFLNREIKGVYQFTKQ